MKIYKKIIDLKNKNQTFVVAIVVHTEGSAPGKVGFKMIVEPDGNITGTVGGGSLEKHVIEEALNRIAYGASGIQEYLLSDKANKADPPMKVIPMKCSGKVMIYYGVHSQLPAVYLFGGGHVGKALLYNLMPLDYHLVLIDNREEFANEKENPNASEIEFMDYLEYAGKFEPLKESFIVIMTQEHQYDYELLKTAIQRKLDVKYIGVIASKTKAADMLDKLKSDLGEDVDISKVFMPIGLKIGGNSAEEIALSVAAQIQAVRYGKNGE